jgi:hypothetical protein
MFRFAACLVLAGVVMMNADTCRADEASVLNSVTCYCSFDDVVGADLGVGKLTFNTRYNHETEKGKFVIESGFDTKIFRVAKGKGISGGALEATDVLPRNGRIFLPAKGNLAYKPGGWSGSMSIWCNTNPDTQLKTKFCDPIQITEKGANNGGLWFDFNDAKPRDLRHGAFPAVPEGGKPISEDDPNAPMVRVPKIGWETGKWHHVVLTWENLDTGKADARTALYIDAKLIGDVKGRAIAMNWDVEKAGVYVAVGYIGLLDELTLFNKALTLEEIGMLNKTPNLPARLRVKPKP